MKTMTLRSFVKGNLANQPAYSELPTDTFVIDILSQE